MGDESAHSIYFLYLIAMIEVGFFAYLVYRIKKIITVYKSERDNYYFKEDSLYAAVGNVIGTNMIIRLIFSETSVFFYAFLGWKLKKSDTSKGTLFTYHKTIQYGILFWVIFVITIITAPVLHFLLIQWHVSVAWVVTGLTIYSLIWFCGDYNIIKHKPIVLLENKLLIRIGIRWKADIALPNIQNVESIVSEEEEKAYTNLTLLVHEKNIFITLHEPVRIEGMFGIMKTTSKIALYVDEPYGFIEKIS